MDQKKHTELLGLCWAKFNTLETVLRIYLLRYNKQSESGFELQEGDTCPETYLTNYMTFKELLSKYNKAVDNNLKILHGDKIVRFRDAMAHGRTVTQTVQQPLTVYKFSKPKNKSVKLEIKQVLSESYLKDISAILHESTDILVKALNQQPEPQTICTIHG
jgi:hypothetical protein